MLRAEVSQPGQRTLSSRHLAAFAAAAVTLALVAAVFATGLSPGHSPALPEDTATVGFAGTSVAIVSGEYHVGGLQAIYTNIVFVSDNGTQYSTYAGSTAGQYSINLPVLHYYTVIVYWQLVPSYVQSWDCTASPTQTCSPTSGSLACGSLNISISDVTYDLPCRFLYE